MDKDFMLNYFNKAVQPEWEELLKTPRYAASGVYGRSTSFQL